MADSGSDALESRIKALWRDRRPAEAFELVDQLREPTPWLARVWMQVGSRRALVPLLPMLGGELRAECERFIAEGPGPIVIPTGTRAELDALARDLASRGLAHELAHCHLGLTELDLRVDERVGHLEAASALADQLGDPALKSLVCAYEGRLDAHLGEDEDARERAETAHTLGLEQREPRAIALALAVRAVLDGDTTTLEEVRPRLVALGFDPEGYGFTPRPR